jgi:PhnB protein
MSDIHEVYAYLRVHDAPAAIEFYKQAFGAEEILRLAEPGGRIGHAELRFGPATIMLSDEYPEHGILGPLATGRSSVAIHLHLGDVDRAFERALGAGASVVKPLTNQFYGERSGTLRDPFGHEWILGGHIEEVTAEEMQRRYTALLQK